MDSPGSSQLDIFQIYRRYCCITTGMYACGEEGYTEDEESLRGKFSRQALNQLLKLVKSKVHTRVSIFDEIFKLMSKLDLMVDFSEFSRFYDFVFFICRENGQRNITVSRAVMSWRLVLAGRFRLLKQWCEFVEKNQQHNISEDTWRQVLVFSRCVHENLEGYDPEGAWPVLIDDFVEHMYRTMGSNYNSNLFSCCGDLKAQPFGDRLPGLKTFPGLKRKMSGDFQRHNLESLDKVADYDLILSSKGRYANKLENWEENPPGIASNGCTETVKHNGQLDCSKCPCAIEGSQSKGLLFDRERRISYPS